MFYNTSLAALWSSSFSSGFPELASQWLHVGFVVDESDFLSVILPDIIEIIERKIFQWYGHVKTMPEQILPKLIME